MTDLSIAEQECADFFDAMTKARDVLDDAIEAAGQRDRSRARAAAAAAVVGSIDVVHLDRQAEWSARTFGTGRRTRGLIDHITKEFDEILADPDDLLEWIDVIILAFDGAWRTGATPAEIITAIKTKQAANEARTWPDFRDFDEDQAIEHVRGAESLVERLAAVERERDAAELMVHRLAEQAVSDEARIAAVEATVRSAIAHAEWVTEDLDHRKLFPTVDVIQPLLAVLAASPTPTEPTEAES